MSDEQNEEPTEEDVLAVMSDPELLAEHGYRLTPKGHMALILMKMGVDKESADKIADLMGNQIFDAGWTYVPTEGLDLEIPDGI